MCRVCKDEKSFYKPDIVFFHEQLPEDFHAQISIDMDECDLLIVMGSSMRVQPVAKIPRTIRHMKQI